MTSVFKRMAVGVVALGFVAAFGLTVLAQAQQGPAQPRQGRPWGPGPRAHAMALGFALGQLDLTAAQREQVHGILQQHRDEARALMQQARAARQTLNKAVETLPVDEAAIRSASTGLAEVHTQQALARARVRSEVWQLLTPEQRAKAETLKAEMRERAKQRHERPMPQ
jgi:Spy/CpxP family protein refolding chaperone